MKIKSTYSTLPLKNGEKIKKKVKIIIIITLSGIVAHFAG